MPASAAVPTQLDEALASRIRRAVLWRSGSQLVAQVMQRPATFLVIRILTPRDYGLFAMAQVVLALLNMANGYGLAGGLIQRREVGEREIDARGGRDRPWSAISHAPASPIGRA